MVLRGTAPWTSSKILIVNIYKDYNDNDLRVLLIVDDLIFQRYFKIYDIFKIFSSYNLVYFLITYMAPLAIMAVCYLQMGRWVLLFNHDKHENHDVRCSNNILKSNDKKYTKVWKNTVEKSWMRRNGTSFRSRGLL